MHKKLFIHSKFSVDGQPHLFEFIW